MLFILRLNTRGGKPLVDARLRLGEEAQSRLGTGNLCSSAADLLCSLVQLMPSSLPVSPLSSVIFLDITISLGMEAIFCSACLSTNAISL